MRKLLYEASFDFAVEALGGYRAVDVALEPILDGLIRNPYGFNVIENDWTKMRYVITKATLDIPALLVMFKIEEGGDVALVHAEKYERY